MTVYLWTRLLHLSCVMSWMATDFVLPVLLLLAVLWLVLGKPF